MSLTQEPIYPGDLVTLIAKFYHPITGAPSSPSDVTGAVTDESGTTVAVVFAEVTEGDWRAPWVPTVHGQHTWRASGVGAIQKSGEKTIKVNKQRVPPA